MRPLNKLEMREFHKTFDFIDYYIGCARNLKAKSIHEIRFDGVKCPPKLISFIMNKYQDNLIKVNEDFNRHTTQHHQKMIQRLISYCFKAGIQPHELRVRKFNTYTIVPNEEPIETIFGSVA